MREEAGARGPLIESATCVVHHGEEAEVGAEIQRS